MLLIRPVLQFLRYQDKQQFLDCNYSQPAGRLSEGGVVLVLSPDRVTNRSLLAVPHRWQETQPSVINWALTLPGDGRTVFSRSVRLTHP